MVSMLADLVAESTWTMTMDKEIQLGQIWKERSRPGHTVEIVNILERNGTSYGEVTVKHLTAHNQRTQTSPSILSFSNLRTRYDYVGEKQVPLFKPDGSSRSNEEIRHEAALIQGQETCPYSHELSYCGKCGWVDITQKKDAVKVVADAFTSLREPEYHISEDEDRLDAEIAVKALKKAGLMLHQPMMVLGEIECCDTCTNSEGNPVAWDSAHPSYDQAKVNAALLRYDQVARSGLGTNTTENMLYEALMGMEMKRLGYNV